MISYAATVTVSHHSRAASECTVALEPFTHGSDGGICIGHELFQGLEIGEDVAPLVDTSLGCPRHGYSGYRSSMSDRVTQPVNRTNRVDDGRGKESLHLDLLDSLSESHVILVVFEAARSLRSDPQNGHGEVLQVGGHANDVLPDLLVSAAVEDEEDFHIDANLAKNIIPAGQIVLFVTHRFSLSSNGSEFSCAAQVPRYRMLVSDDGARNLRMPHASRQLQFLVRRHIARSPCQPS